jgi:alkyldihydroxyacetonephosphate synthase
MDSSGSPAESPSMRWWGWGEPNGPPLLSPTTLARLGAILGATLQRRPPVALEAVRLPARSLEPSLDRALRQIVGEAGVNDGHDERVRHAAGRGYTDLVGLRAGLPEGAPDAVLWPADHDQVRAVLELCAAHGVAVVPFGGGTSVVGGVAPLRGGHGALIALDTRRMDGVLSLDRTSRIATVQSGIRVAALESWLGARGLTLGHFPQSFHYVAVGGCAATRSVGQASTGYGSIAGMIQGLRLATPTGELALAAVPASAAGPGLRELVIGSEGTLGVITELALKVRLAPASRGFEGLFFRSFSDGVRALALLTQSGLAPAIARLSDERETETSLLLSAPRSMRDRVGRAYLRARGYRPGCLLILGFEEAEAKVLAARRQSALELLRGEGAFLAGSSPGRAWAAARYSAPYLRDELLTHGVMAETLETATRWSNVGALHRGVADAIERELRSCGTPGLVMCHLSHLYETGASLYFTFLARQLEGRELEQWRAVKWAASETILSAGATITHHHGVGRDHAAWMNREVGPQGVVALRALKAQLDPTGIMNPGKLLPDASNGG